jgi:glycosyltransferase involved in cell wall biosynthesis
MAPRIAVVVSTRDRAQLIRGMLSSLRNQTINDWECIIIQDWEGDDTSFVISTLADKRIKLFENGGEKGKSGALNFAKSKVTAPLVKFFDDDDYLVPCALEMYASMMEETGADMGYSARYTLALNNQVVYTPNREFSMEAFLERPMVGTGSLVVKKGLYDSIDYDTCFPASMDFDFICKCAMTGAKVAYTDLPLYMYRNHLNSITFDANPLQAMYYDKAKCRIQEELKQRKVSNELVRWAPPGLR